MVPAWVMIIRWAYLKLLFITRTDKLRLVPSNYLFCGLMFLYSCVASLISLFSFHMRIKSQQILESLARKWNILEQNGLATVAIWLKQRESITHNSNLSYLIPFLVVPCSSSYPSFTAALPLCTMYNALCSSASKSAGVPSNDCEFAFKYWVFFGKGL